MSDIKRLLSGAYMLGYGDARNDKAIDPTSVIERLTLNLNKVYGAYPTENDSISRQDALEMSFSHGIHEDGKLYVSYSEVMNNIRQLPSTEDEPIIFPSRCCGKSIVIRAYKLGWKNGREALTKALKGELNDNKHS